MPRDAVRQSERPAFHPSRCSRTARDGHDASGHGGEHPDTAARAMSGNSAVRIPPLVSTSSAFARLSSRLGTNPCLPATPKRVLSERSEHVLHSELDYPWRAGLRGDAAELSRVDIGDGPTSGLVRAGIAPVERVEEIEGLEAELQRLHPRDADLT